jgi:hypothetical protein
MNKRKWFIAFGISLLLVRCNSFSSSNITQTTEIIEPTRQNTPSPIITSTQEPSPTSTLTQRPSPTLTQTMTNTPEPQLTEPVGECRLPCWWGITPGLTTWDNALKKLESHELQTVEPDYAGIKLPNNLGSVGVYRKEDGLVYWIEINSRPFKGIQYYDLLTDYGEPSEIYFYTFNAFQTRPPWLGKGERPAHVIYYYASKGILADYEFFGKLNETTNIITVCPKITDQKLWLDTIGTEYTKSDISQNVQGGGLTLLKIEEATPFSKHDFYMLYKDKKQTKCFETPLSLWH